MKYRFLTPASHELQEAIDYYEEIEMNLGLRLLQDFKKALDRIMKHPEAWPLCYGEFRKCRLNVFPYSIVYLIQSDEILIVALPHAKREPRYWKSRI